MLLNLKGPVLEFPENKRFFFFFWEIWSQDRETMTARDVTGFYVFCSAQKSGNFLHIWGDFTSNYTEPCPSVPWLFGFYQGKPSNSPRIFFPCRTHKFLGKGRENAKITKEIPCWKLTKEIQKTKERKDREDLEEEEKSTGESPKIQWRRRPEIADFFLVVVKCVLTKPPPFTMHRACAWVVAKSFTKLGHEAHRTRDEAWALLLCNPSGRFLFGRPRLFFPHFPLSLPFRACSLSHYSSPLHLPYIPPFLTPRKLRFRYPSDFGTL